MKLDDYNVRFFVTLFLVLIFSIWVIRFCRNYLIFYSKFPNIFCLSVLLRSVLCNEKPKATPATSFYFQKWLNIIKERQRDGFSILWAQEMFLVVNNAEAIKFFSNEPTATDKPGVYGVFTEVLGLGLLTRNGPLWKKHRKMLDPVFKISALKDKIRNVNKNSKCLVESLSKVPREASVEILEHLKLTVFINIFEFLLNIDCSVPEKQMEIKSIVRYVDKAAETITYRIMHPWLLPKFTLPLFSKGREFLKGKKAERVIEKLIQEIFSLIRPNMSEDTDASLEEPSGSHTFCELLAKYVWKDSSFTLSDVKDHLYILVSAGYDTISHTMMFCLFLLGHNPEIQEKVYNELEEVMMNDSLSYDDLRSLRYMECVLKETMRLYPPLPLFARRLQKTLKFRNYIIPKRTNLVFIPFLCHRDPAFFPNPDKFEPERFLEYNNDVHQWPFIPFAEGIRNCIGKRFALMEMKILLAHILKKFKVTSVENIEDVQLTWEVVLNTADPLHVRLTSRH